MPLLVVVVALLSALLLGACAAPARMSEMIVDDPGAAKLNNSELVGAIEIRNVTGGEDTNPMWTSEVSNQEFHDALSASLSKHHLLSTDAASSRFTLDANLLGVAQPAFGFDMTVTTHVNYTLLAAPSGTPYLAETVSADFTAGVGDAFIGVERLRLANEGSIKANIQKFLEMFYR